MPSDIYEVTVDAAVPHGEGDAAIEEVVHSNDAEIHLSPDRTVLRVVEQVVCDTPKEAYRRAANVTEAQLQAGGIRPADLSCYEVEAV